MQNLKEHQPPMSVDEQISNLRENGLIINDEDYARSILNDVSYFRIIKAYSLGMKERNGKYHENVCFEDIVNLYMFNSKLRQLLFIEIEKVEINLRCRLSNYFCEKYGVFGYEDIGNFAVSAGTYRSFYNGLEREIARNSRTQFIRNFQDNYVDGKIPLYALVEVLSFGSLSKFYKNMKNEDKKAVGLMFGIGYTYLESWIESLAYIRNVCAHYGRLYNNKIVITPSMYKQYSEFGNNHVFATLLTLKHIFRYDKNWESVVQNIEQLINEYPNVKLQSIGFPQGWIEYLRSGEST